MLQNLTPIAWIHHIGLLTHQAGFKGSPELRLTVCFPNTSQNIHCLPIRQFCCVLGNRGNPSLFKLITKFNLAIIIYYQGDIIIASEEQFDFVWEEQWRNMIRPMPYFLNSRGKLRSRLLLFSKAIKTDWPYIPMVLTEEMNIRSQR